MVSASDLYLGDGERKKKTNRSRTAGFQENKGFDDKSQGKIWKTMVEIVLINPAYTSQVGMEKFGERMKLNRHQAASYVIARRGQGFQDKLKKRIRKVG